jgi:hypothetical protein
MRMSLFLRGIGLGLVWMLPVVASCPRPTPPPVPPHPPQQRLSSNLLRPGTPHATDAKTFREQIQHYLRQKAGLEALAARNTGEPLMAALAYGKAVPGVTLNPQGIVCGDRGCFMEVRFKDQAAFAAFERKMLGEEASPFFRWGWGAGVTHPEPVAPGGLVSTWYFNVPKRRKLP